MSTNSKCENETIVKLNFLSGYTARQMFSLIDNLVGEIPIYFHKDRFEIKYASVLESETGKKIGVEVIPMMNKILNYETSDNFFVNGNEVLQMNPSRNEFNTYLKSVNKRDGLDLCVKSNSPDTLLVNVTKNSPSGVNEITFKHVEINNFNVSVEEFTSPNIKIPLNELCNGCSLVGKQKNNFKGIVFIGYQRGVGLIGEKYTNSSALETKWGDCSGNEIARYSLNIEKVKALSGISSITENGVVCFYFSRNKMRMDIPISYYADMLLTFCYGETKNDVAKVDKNTDFLEQDIGIDKFWIE